MGSQVVVGPYWPVPGVTKPQHLWPFSQTGDYTDHGSSLSPVTLTPGGVGNTFGAGGLILSGTGWASTVLNTDLTDIGSVYSLLIEYTVSPTSANYPPIVSAGTLNTDGYSLFGTAGHNTALDYRLNADQVDYRTVAAILDSVSYQIIITSAGTGANQIAFYVNGSPDSTHTGIAVIAGTAGFWVGYDISGGVFTGTIKKVGILKGTAWSSGDVAAIYSKYA